MIQVDQRAESDSRQDSSSPTAPTGFAFLGNRLHQDASAGGGTVARLTHCALPAHRGAYPRCAVRPSSPGDEQRTLSVSSGRRAGTRHLPAAGDTPGRCSVRSALVAARAPSGQSVRASRCLPGVERYPDRQFLGGVPERFGYATGIDGLIRSITRETPSRVRGETLDKLIASLR
jgi:hypothetical protein